MRVLFAALVACVACLPGSPARAQAPAPDADPLLAEQRDLAERAKAILADWRDAGEGDERARRPLVIALFTGNDTDPAPNYRERLTRTMQHIQAFYAQEMKRNGFGEMTFSLENEEDGLLKIYVVRGERPNDQYNGDHGKEIRELVVKQLAKHGIDGNQQTLVIFCNLTKWDPATRRMSHHSPYYAGGSSRSGTAWQLDSPLLDVAQITNTDPDQFLHDGQYGRISLGRYQSIFVGGVCHELGHALGLPHNKERPDEARRWGTALMGSGNFTYGREEREDAKGSFLTLTHAMKLAAHPAFTGSVKQMHRRPDSRYTRLSLEPIDQGKGVRVSGKVQSDIPVHAVLAYLDPQGNKDYNATTHLAVPDAQGRFTIDCAAFEGKAGRLRLAAVHANGWAPFYEDIATTYTRDPAGVVSVQPFDLDTQRAHAVGAGPNRPAALPDPSRCPCCRPPR
ncbi:MAG: hypothetical protein ACE37H_14125 [Phycisphaeraceae bacterium]